MLVVVLVAIAAKEALTVALLAVAVHQATGKILLPIMDTVYLV
jgi:hypothetical protein